MCDATRVVKRIQEELTLPSIWQQECHQHQRGHRPRHKSYDKPEDLLRDADTAMYRAKVLGKARYEVFDTAMHVVTLLQLETSPWAVERQEFRITTNPLCCWKPAGSLVLKLCAGSTHLVASSQLSSSQSQKKPSDYPYWLLVPVRHAVRCAQEAAPENHCQSA